MWKYVLISGIFRCLATTFFSASVYKSVISLILVCVAIESPLLIVVNVLWNNLLYVMCQK